MSLRTEHDVVIAGGGPTGRMLAAELVLAGVDPLVIERRVDAELTDSRAGGLHARTIEVLDQRGIADRFLAEGRPMQVQSFSGIPLDISDFPTRHNYGLALWQRDFERILTGWTDEIGVRVERGCAVEDFTQDRDGVDVGVSDGRRLRAGWLIGCDGGRSVVRRAAGIGFPGWEPTVSSLVAEVQMADDPPLGLRRDDRGQQAIGRLEDGRIRCVVTESFVPRTGEPILEDLSRGLIEAFGSDFGVHSPTWISRFTDAARQADSYRRGRVLVAGDAAHVHYPIGGQGLGVGIQDAVNLGWKLGQVVKGVSSEELLDSYHDERHPVAARVLQNTLAQTAVASGGDRVTALRDVLTRVLALDDARRLVAAMMSGLDIRYDLGGEHPLTGWRAPDLDLETEDGPTRVYELLWPARPVLLNLGQRGAADGWASRLDCVDARAVGDWVLPVVGAVPDPEAVLIRPDGHVAWAGDPAGAELAGVMAKWVGE